jgi:hypothetical protein
MSEENGLLSLPFLIRKMLSFDFATSFKLRVRYRYVPDSDFYVSGATRSGTFTYKIKPSVNGVAGYIDLPITDVPIWVSVIDSDDNFYLGELYAQVFLMLNDNIVHSLCAGYIGDGNSISFPRTEFQPSAPNHEYLTEYTGTNPAAGAECLITIPADELWQVKAFTVTLVTDATVANRTVDLVFNDLGNNIAANISNATQTAGITREYVFTDSGINASRQVGTSIFNAYPQDVWLGPGGTIRTSCGNLQAGDNFGTPVVSYRQFISMT